MQRDMAYLRHKVERNTVFLLGSITLLGLAWVTHKFTALNETPLILTVVGSVGVAVAIVNYFNIYIEGQVS